MRARDLQVGSRRRPGLRGVPRRSHYGVARVIQPSQLHSSSQQCAGQQWRELYLRGRLRWQRQQWGLLGLPAQHHQIGHWRCRRVQPLPDGRTYCGYSVDVLVGLHVPGQHGAERRGGRLRVHRGVLRVGGVLQRLRARDLQVRRRRRRRVHALRRWGHDDVPRGFQLSQLHGSSSHGTRQHWYQICLQSGLRWQRQQWDLLGVPAQHLQIGSWRCRWM